MDYFISLVTSDYNKWKYISLIDTKEIQEKLATIRNNTISLIAFFMLVSLVLSYAMYKGIYNPIQLIKSTIDNNTIKLHKYNFYRLLKGEKVEEDELIRNKKLAKLVANIDISLNYQIVLFEFVDLNRNSDESKEIFDRLLGEALNEDSLIEYFYETNSRMVILICCDQLESKQNQTILDQVEFLFETYKQITGGDAYIVISNKATFTGIRDSYEYILKILKYIIVQQKTGIMEEENFVSKKETKRFPYDYQTYLNKSLRDSSLKDCEIIVKELEKVIKSDFYFATNYTFYYKDVLNTIIGFLYEIQYIRSSDMSEIIDNFSEFEKRFSSIDEATTWTLQFIMNIFTFLEDADQSTIETPTIRCIHMIEDEYMNDISLNEVAQRLSLSVPYLSKHFKDETGINFKDYVTLCKINKAKELLISSSMTNELIAQAVGYNTSLQLGRMFKKLENITPSEYRKRNQSI